MFSGAIPSVKERSAEYPAACPGRHVLDNLVPDKRLLEIIASAVTELPEPGCDALK